MTFPKKALELYTHAAEEDLPPEQWREILASEHCRYLGKKCDKIRKSQPNLSIGTCIVGFKGRPIIICPHRFLQRRQIFIDALHLLKNHVPGNQLHVVPEIAVPGGNVDYFVASTGRDGVKDYVAVEIQTLDTTGTVWPSRQQFIGGILGMPVEGPSPENGRSYGMNWKMTAKTVLVQIHHKLETLELLNKKMVLVLQDVFYEYLIREFSAANLREADSGDAAHFHVYSVGKAGNGAFSIELAVRQSTTTIGIEQMLGLRRSAHIPEEDLLARIQAKISDVTLLQI